ncbi:hypothetical protein [Limnohabitans sp. DM1]|uniref:hypothetical protein n=1 Tax=Limnohabitans sp. DM1 TaxID=1597955 RepID=UPI000A98A9E2|nr:hypothetical protein [Limnohabitans sp. DM1]
MKIATKITGFLMSCMTLYASVQPLASMAQNTEMARPRSTIDLSRTDRLTGTPNPQENPLSCPSGQVYSGGTCVLISNQSSSLANGLVSVTALNNSVFPGCPSGFVQMVSWMSLEVEGDGYSQQLRHALCAKK